MSSEAKPSVLACDYSLLDKVDKLRELGMQDFFPLPQIAVVGDQSSGKSSLLEYISGVTFPKDSNFCTCFVTEVTMRPEPVFSAEILLNGKPDPRLPVPQSAEEVADVIDQAKLILSGGNPNEKGRIYEDIVTVKLRGPQFSCLTLVDLPGYTQTRSKGQEENFVEKIEALCEKYLQSSSTIILAVIPANKDFETNTVMQHISRVDGKGERTLCVLTKPDQVDRGTEGGVIGILSGEKMTLSRGYHIVKNRNYEDCQAGISREATVRKEAHFFSLAPWSKVDESQRGVDRLVAKLTDYLTVQVQNEFPGIRQLIKDRKEKDEKQLKQLGPGVETDFDKICLVQSNIAQITRQLKYLVDGQYSAVLDLGSEFYIRAHVKILNDSFRQEIINATNHQLNNLSVAKTMRKSRGRELQGMFQFDVFVVLFRSILQEWREPTQTHVDQVFETVREVTREVINKTSPDILLDYIREGMDDYLDQKEKIILAEVEEFQDDESTPFTCQHMPTTSTSQNNHYSPTQCVLNSERLPNPNRSTASEENSDDEPDSTEEHFEMRARLRVYSKIAVDRYVDNICLCAIERNLFKKCENRIIDFFNKNKQNFSRIRESSDIRSLRKKLPENIRKFEEALKEF